MMPFGKKKNCPCCNIGSEEAEIFIKTYGKKGLSTNDKKLLLKFYHHCLPCWFLYHNGARDMDYEDEKTFIKNNMGWFKVKEMAEKLVKNDKRHNA